MTTVSIWGRGNSSKALAKHLGVRRNYPADVVIVWKRVEDIPFRHKVEINPVNVVAKSSNKYKQLVAFHEAGLHVPPFCTSLHREAVEVAPNDIWFGRDFYHTKGRDIEVIKFNSKRLARFDDHEYYIKYLKPIGEYRYHVAFGKVILPTKKILAEGEKDDTLIRNHQNGKWLQVVCKPTDRFVDASIKAVKSLGLHFGAVDFLNIDGQAYILEVNTAPSLEVENRLEAYGEAFKTAIAKGVR